MKVINTSTHGIFDYITGLALLVAPNLFGFAEIGGAAVAVPRFLGLLILGHALFTRYELGVVKLIPMRLHLINDYIVSLFLLASPWLFGFADAPANAWVPHVVVGALGFLVALMTRAESYSHTATYRAA